MWKPIILDRIPSTSSTLTISKSGINFSAKFVKTFNLEEKVAVRFFQDDEDIYKLGFEFLDETGGVNSLVFRKNKHGDARGSGKHVKATEVINSRKILRKIQNDKLKENRTFEIKTTNNNPNIYFIDLLPCFEFSVKFENVGKIDNMAKGIYRYINSENNIIYIGKGNIKARAKIPQRIEWGICLIEYSIVEDNDTAYKWEEYYLQKYVERHGVKPAFNVVMGHHQDED